MNKTRELLIPIVCNRCGEMGNRSKCEKPGCALVKLEKELDKYHAEKIMKTLEPKKQFVVGIGIRWVDFEKAVNELAE